MLPGNSSSFSSSSVRPFDWADKSIASSCQDTFKWIVCVSNQHTRGTAERRQNIRWNMGLDHHNASSTHGCYTQVSASQKTIGSCEKQGWKDSKDMDKEASMTMSIATYHVKQATLTGGLANFLRTTVGREVLGCITGVSPVLTGCGKLSSTIAKSRSIKSLQFEGRVHSFIDSNGVWLQVSRGSSVESTHYIGSTI